jgi:TPP-dependent pyruvate/acetoin dehydrogenase alpha subunit
MCNTPERAAPAAHKLVTLTAQDRRLRQLETMMLIRAYEEQLIDLQRKGAPGTCTSIGQEASAVGVIDALDSRDRILTNHRSAGHLIARGAELTKLLAEVLGRVDGYCGGRSGSLHISVKELGVVLTSTIVGGELSMAPGVALAQKMGQGEPGGIVVVFFGDGAACEGIFHESLNLAVLWQLPLLFVCENNQWQAYVHRLQAMPDKALLNWAKGHGLAARSVYGNDVGAVYEAAVQTVAEIRANSQPQFLELVTYRQRGHIEPDDQAYVDPQEKEYWLQRDPVESARKGLLRDGLLNDGCLAAIKARTQDQIEAALAFAQASAWPAVEQLTDHVYL